MTERKIRRSPSQKELHPVLFADSIIRKDSQGNVLGGGKGDWGVAHLAAEDTMIIREGRWGSISKTFGMTYGVSSQKDTNSDHSLANFIVAADSGVKERDTD